MKNTTKDLVSDIVNIQNQVVESIVSSTKKVQENIGKADVVEKTREAATDFLAKQQAIIESASATIKSHLNYEAVPTVVKEIVEAQENFGKAWFEALRATLQSKNSKDLVEIYNVNVKKAQESINDIYAEALKTAGKPVTEFSMPSVDTIKDAFKKSLDLLKPVYSLN